MLGDRNRRHLQLDRLIEHLVDPARAVEQRVFGVEVKMDEIVTLVTPDPQILKSSDPGIHPYSHSIVDGGFELMS